MLRVILLSASMITLSSFSGCVIGDERPRYQEISFEDASAKYGFSYYLNVISNLGMIKVCVPRETSLGILKDVSIEFNDKFKTAASPYREQGVTNEYLFSFSIANELPKLDISAMYRDKESFIELVVVAENIGGSSWSVTEDTPVAIIDCR